MPGTTPRTTTGAIQEVADALTPEAGTNQITTSRNIVASGNTTLVTATATQRVRLKAFLIVNNGGSVNDVGLRFAAAGTIYFGGDLAVDGGQRGLNLLGAYIEGALGEALIVNINAAGDVSVTVITELLS